MIGWLAWHGLSAALTVERLRDSHLAASAVHDSILRLETEIQRTAQLFIATGQTRWLSLHARSEGELRAVLSGLLETLTAIGRPGEEWIREALAALDALSKIEGEAFALLDAGMDDAALAKVTGPEYMAGLDWLGESIRRFDEYYHAWLISDSLGLNRREIGSLLGAFLLFALAIGAWLALVRRLQQEKTALAEEMQARARAEDELLRNQKLELLGQLAGGVAHDLDNVLSATAGYTLLARQAADEEHRHRALDGLDRAVGLGRGLTTNLLSFMRREQSEHEPVELRTTLLETRDWLKPLLPCRVELVTDEAGPDALWVDANPVQLHQVFTNLALNAFDAMPDGGTLRISLDRVTDGPRGQQDVCHDGDTVRVEFADTGQGMDPETLARAREPFFSHRPDGKGSGLGLGSVDRILEAHGGRLELESVAGQGTRATVYLPLIEAPVRTTARPSAAPAALVVSPDAYARTLLVDALEDAGLAVTVTTLASLSQGPAGDLGAAEVRVIDWPGRFGELPAELHACLATAGSPVVLLLEPGPAMEIGQGAATAAAGDVFVVSRATALGEVGRFVQRLVARKGQPA